ncbi:hypothetical protein C1I63_07070 [Rathayibacter caricis DSM 15933]|uniref:DUF4190 domain-containing protein n=1 Tax=Rathayibacter caricis DSM 15933 TaxID=1328867 RepID=A0A2T4USW5_9MICO|nr:hypothetical protein [Rathayibacter caricis]PTL72628.1 hypothetical protein C1I63_07070 [Rathayibacter caricis DSM 15933]
MSTGRTAASPAYTTTVVLAVTGLVLALFPVFDVAGLVLSILAFRRSRHDGGPRGLALAGIIVASVTIVLFTAGAVLLGTLFGGLFATCAELGEGVHVVDGVTYTCS